MKRGTIEMVLAAVLLAGVVGSGVLLVTTTHESRQLFQELEALRREQDRLQDEWSALRIEVSSLAGHARIDRIAREELGFIDPLAHSQFAEIVP